MTPSNTATPPDANPLGTAPIGSLLIKFSIPSIISMMVSVVYNITDQIFIGHVVGMLGNAATNVVFPVVTLTLAFAMLVGLGTAANFNLSLGAGRQEEAKGFLGTGLLCMPLVGLVILAVVLLLRTPILLLCGATESVLPYAQLYLGIVAFGLPFQLFCDASSPLIRADGSPSYAMACIVTGAALNVFLDWLFMFPLQMGIQGAALATVTGQVVACLLCLRYFTRFRTFPVTRSMLGLRPVYLVQIVKLGLSEFCNQLIIMLVNILLNNTLKHYGGLSVYGSDIPLAVSGVVAKLNSILVAFSVGLAQGCQPIWGFNMGAKNYPRVKAAYKTALSAALVVSVTAFLLFQFFPRPIVGIFGTGDELYFQFAEQYLRIYLFMVCVFVVQPLSTNYFAGIGDAKRGLLLAVSRQGLFLIPLLLLLPLAFGLEGALYAGPIADALAFLLSVVLIRQNFKKLSALWSPFAG